MEQQSIDGETLSKRIMKSNLNDDDKIKLIVMVEEKEKPLYSFLPFQQTQPFQQVKPVLVSQPKGTS